MVSCFNCNDITVHNHLPAASISEQSCGNLPDKRQNRRSHSLAMDKLKFKTLLHAYQRDKRRAGLANMQTFRFSSDI